MQGFSHSEAASLKRREEKKYMNRLHSLHWKCIGSFKDNAAHREGLNVESKQH